MIRKLAVDFDITQLKWNEQGIIPAVIQDRVSKQVLMVAYMNQESLSKTIETGETWFYSRSRQELWHKGKTSGHFQKITELQLDCDQDTLLIQVEQIGVACHTGTYTCFGEDKQNLQNHSQEGNNSLPMLDQLITLIAEREKTMPEGSYTTYLFEKGLDKILKKVGEEASEVIIAAKNQQPEEVVSEASDLIYHLLVLLQQQGISFDRVLKELARRHQDQSSDVKFIRQRK